MTFGRIKRDGIDEHEIEHVEYNKKGERMECSIPLSKSFISSVHLVIRKAKEKREEKLYNTKEEETEVNESARSKGNQKETK